MSKKLISRVILAVLFCSLTVCTGALGAKEKEFKNVELDGFIVREKNAIGNGRKVIKLADPISFEAKMKRHPEERQMSYIYKALEVAGVNPMPEVNHRMFIESEEGRIIPVYVEKNVVEKLIKGLKVEGRAKFIGYHVYSYAKGPAILVVDFNVRK